MCPNDNPAGQPRPPQVPRRLDSLFDNEAGSDVTFLVGPESETWRFPGHRNVLSDANPVFRAMLQGPLADTGPTIAIEDIHGKAFDLLLRFLYKEDVVFGSIQTALDTLYAAYKYMCAGLVRSCVLYLNDHLTPQSVLQVYQHMRVYCIHHHTRDRALGVWIASAPSVHEDIPPPYSVTVDKDTNDNLHTMSYFCSSLLSNCLHYIDTHADEVLADEGVEDLTDSALRDIALRDTLTVSSELILFNAMERWCNRECKRGKLQLSTENRRSILGPDLLFSPRYLLMTPQELVSGPMHSGLFDQSETTVLMAHILNAPNKPVIPALPSQVLEMLRTPRRKPDSMPINLTTANCKKDKKGCFKKSKSEKKQKKKKCKDTSVEEPSSKKCSGSCFLEYMFRALSCLFD